MLQQTLPLLPLCHAPFAFSPSHRHLLFIDHNALFPIAVALSLAQSPFSSSVICFLTAKVYRGRFRPARSSPAGWSKNLPFLPRRLTKKAYCFAQTLQAAAATFSRQWKTTHLENNFVRK